ncbi:hypothetical protein [Lentisphaera araneosa]|uniref:hypothetical protein n=1 Tax=Lentisphaera araneosa TaxID=256847 RepID=UPI0012FA9525|nr:hypothetical protein [Lentisphaera araneosa]
MPKLKGGKGHGEGDRRPVIIDETLYCDPFAYEISTGELDESFAWKTVKRKGCGQNSKILMPNIHI